MNLGKIRFHNNMENDFLTKFKCCIGKLLRNYAKSIINDFFFFFNIKFYFIR